MLEPLHLAGQWAWQQAASKVNTVGSLPAPGGSSVPLNLPYGVGPESSGEQTHSKGFKPILPGKAFGQRLWNRGRQKVQQLAEQAEPTIQKITGRKSPVKPRPEPRAPVSGFRPRQQVLKDFPYNEVGKLPRFTLTPDEIRANPAAERLHQLEETQVFNAPWDSGHLFNPFLEH